MAIPMQQYAQPVTNYIETTGALQKMAQAKQAAEQSARLGDLQMRQGEQSLKLGEIGMQAKQQQMQETMWGDMARAAAWADTPEKWEQALDFFEGSGFEVDQFRGRPELRDMVMRLGHPQTRSEALREMEMGLRKRELDIKESAEQRMKNKLSAGLEKALIDAQDFTVKAQREANNYDLLANNYEQLKIGGGLEATVSETLKKMLGTQDDVTEFRRRFNQIRISEGLKNLPPGPASDVDVQMAMKGVPPENASPEQVASFLRGAGKLARFEAAYNQFKADYITDKRDAGGLNKEWRKKVKSSKLGREVSIAEIYSTAQNRGITPEDVKAQLGIEE